MQNDNFIKRIFKKTDVPFYKEVKHYLSAEILIKSAGLLALPIITELLSPDEFGILKIYESLVLIFVILAGLALPSAIKRNFYEKSSDFNVFVGSSINFILIFNFLLFPLIYVFRKSISSYLNLDGRIVLIAWLIAFLIVFYRIYTEYLQADTKSKEFSIVKIVQGILLLVVSIVWIYLLKEQRYYGKIYSDLLISSLFLVFIIFRVRSFYSFTLNKSKLKLALSFSLPMIPALLSGFALSYFDQIIINDLKGSYQTGLYSIAYQIGMIVYMIQLSTSAAYQPYFFEALVKGDISDFKKLIKKYTKFINFIAALLILFSTELGIVLTDEKYSEGLILVPVIVFSYTFFYIYTVYANYFIYLKKTSIASLIVIFSAVANIVLNYIYIPVYGYFAAAFTTLFSYFVQFIMFWILTHVVIKNKGLIIELKMFLKEIIIVVISGFVYFVLYFYKINIFIGLILKVIFIILSGYLVFKDIILSNRNPKI